MPSTRTDCSDPATSARPPVAFRLVWRSCWLTCAAVMPCAWSAAGSSTTRMLRSTPPSRVTAAMPSTPSIRRATLLSTYHDNSSRLMSVVSAATYRIGSPAKSTRAICGSRIPSGRSLRIWVTASRRSLTARSVGVPMSNWTKVSLLPSRTELLISSTPLTERAAASTFCVIWFSISVGAAPGCEMTDRGGRKIDVGVVVDAHPRERDQPGQHQPDEQDDRRHRIAGCTRMRCYGNS